MAGRPPRGGRTFQNPGVTFHICPCTGSLGSSCLLQPGLWDHEESSLPLPLASGLLFIVKGLAAPSATPGHAPLPQGVLFTRSSVQCTAFTAFHGCPDNLNVQSGYGFFVFSKADPISFRSPTSQSHGDKAHSAQSSGVTDIGL